MKLLITTLNLHYNRVNNALVDLLNNLDFKKYHVDLLVMEPGELELELDERINIMYYKDYMLMPSKLFYNFKKNHIVNDLYNQFRFAFKNTYDVAIAYYGDNNYVDMIPASVKALKKIIWVHSVDKLNFNTKYDFFDNIVFETEANMEIFNFKYPKYKDKTLYINNIIDCDKVLKKSKEKTDIKLSNGYNIINISNLNKEFDINKFIEVHRNLLIKNKNIHTYIIGDGKLFYKIAAKIRKYNITDSFILLGKQENPYNILKQASIYLDISNSDKLNNTILESIILEKPCITSSTTIYKEISKYVPLNGMEYVDDNIASKILGHLKEYKNHIPFDYKKYNKENMKKFIELIEK